MAKLYKVNEGKMLFGVCTGLGATGGASVTTWRIVFAVSSLFLFFPIVIYFVMGVALPVAKKKNDISKIEEVEVKKELGGNVDKIEVELEKIKEMRDGLSTQAMLRLQKLQQIGTYGCTTQLI